MTDVRRSTVCFFAFLVLVGSVAPIPLSAARAVVGAPTQDEASGPNGNVDETVAYAPAVVMDAAKQALLTVGCEMKAKKEKPDYVECTRSRHVGVFVGSGGEKITVRLAPSGSETRVEIKTGKGFAGRLGKKNWSRQVFDEMVRTLKAS